MSTPTWPSLYNPSIELIDIEHNAPVQPGGAYLSNSIDVFRFTLYWTLIFYCPIFLLCGLFAFWNLNFPPALRPLNRTDASNPTHHPRESSRRAASHRQHKRSGIDNPRFSPSTRKYKIKERKRSSRLTFAFLVLLTFLAAGLAGAVLTAAILGFIVAAFFRSVDYHMSTWIPFLLAFISSFVGFISLWPSVIDII
ncbi:hypothetical protein JOM56_007198 [Amanita muscaria]